MSLGTVNRDGGKTSESGHLRSPYKGFAGQVLSGLAVSQRGAGANMSVDIAIGDAIIPRSDGTYGHPSFNDAVLNQAITTADPSNPRRDILVMYIDYGQTPSTGVSNNTNGVVKVKVVAGTPAGSPSDPTDSAIQTSVGAGNPFIKLARIRVAAAASSIGNSVIDDLRIMAVGRIQGGWHYDDTNTWVYVSASSFKVAGSDVRAQFPVGTQLALYQGGSLKYFRVTSTSFSTDTTINVDGGGTYTLTNVPIDKPAFSYYKTPQGFPRQTILDQYDGWTELGRATASGGANPTALTVQNLPTMKYLHIIFVQHSGGVTLTSGIRFNNDSGANYGFKTNENGTESGTAGQTFMQTGSNALAGLLADYFVINETAQRKMAEGIETFWDNANGLFRNTYAAYWANTSNPITRVDAVATAGSFKDGSELIILGRN